MATVYLAEDPSTGQEVALKTVRVRSERYVLGIRREIRALARLRHPGVVRIVASGLHDGLPWYAMELVRGPTLSSLVAGRVPTPTQHVADGWTRTLTADDQGPAGSALVGRLELPRLLTVVRALCGSLAHLHGEGLVHRDLKPDNVLLRQDGEPLLVDFGLASVLREPTSRESLDATTELVGTAAYMAPEVIRGETVDARADLYALGCMLYELATGVRPFAAFTVAAVLHAHLATTPPPPSSLVPALPKGLDDLVLRLLEKRPRDRIGHADDVGRVLEQLGARPAIWDAPPPRDYLYRPGFVGRTADLKTLERALQSARRGEGQLVLVGGESGIGKTRLVNEVGMRAAREGFLVLEGEASRASVAAMTLFQGPLRRLVDRCRAVGSEESARIFGSDRASALATFVPEIAELPGCHVGAPPSAGSAATWRALTEVLETVTEDQPVLLVLDDLQWADASSLDALRYLERELTSRARLLVLGTHRLEEPLAALDRFDVSRVVLDRLDEDDAERMVDAMLASPSRLEGDADHDSLARYVASQSEGNPFFVAEYLRAALEGGLLRRDADGRWTLAREGPVRLTLPRTLRALVERRLADLSERARAIAFAAAVVADATDAEALLEIARNEHGDLELEELTRRAVLLPTAEGTLRFTHDKLREVAYDTLPTSERPKWHRRAAEALAKRGASAAELAPHHAKAGDEAAALAAYGRAGDEALARWGYAEAVTLYEEALRRVTDDDPRRSAWEQGFGEACFGLGEVRRGQRHLWRALALRGHPTTESPRELAFGLAQALQVQLVHRLRAPRLVHEGAREDLLATARIYQRLVESHWFDNDAPRMLDAALHALNLAERAGPSPELARAYATLGLATGGLPIHPLAERYSALARETAEVVGELASAVYVRFLQSVYRIGLGQWAAVERDLGEALVMTEKLGDPRFLGESLTTLGMMKLYRGDFEAAEEDFARAGDLGRRFDNGQHRLWSELGIAEVRLRSGQLDAAHVSLRRAEHELGGLAQPLERFRLAGLAASTWLAAGERHEAQAALDRAEAAGAAVRVPTAHYLLEGYAGVVEAHLALGEDPAGLRRALGRFRIYATIFAIGRPRLARLLGERARRHGREREARRHFSRSLAAAETFGMHFEAATARRALSSVR
ncbi:MAG: AAA family ATPase [Sandaracinus sp.]|nr:AAA family ATPase [Sandaracinus sp.]